MGSECGKVVEQGDPEVSEAIDFAHYYAEQGRRLEQVDGAAFAPARLTVVTPPWNFPVAIPAGSTLAALAAGSPVVIKRSEEHTSELQSLMRISYAVFCLKKKKHKLHKPRIQTNV